MKRGLFYLLAFTTISTISAQNTNKDVPKTAVEQYYESPVSRLNQRDSSFLMQLSELQLPENYRNGAKSIPAVIDHSSSQYLQPIFYQVALECGQAAGIAYTFTYEMNRLRNLPSNVLENQYPTHFAWNFKNGGAGSGVNCLETWDVLRMAGSPNKVQWGGSNSFGGSSRWFSGYDNYYEAMKNRIHETHVIPVNTPEGLQTLKFWLYDHLEGSSEGGIANFYSTFVSNGAAFITLPAGTPEGGMKVITQFSSYVNHCQTIIGFNDSIRYDYNGDGLYTNNVDINSDGMVDMRDWEIGGVKFTNSFGTAFADNGFCYMMYNVLAQPLANGGIWNNTVFVIDVKENYNPLATYKATITHPARGRIKVMAGIATNTAATVPEKTMDFSVFNYEGGDLYMQGNDSATAQTIEFGLDISPLLNDVTPGSPTKYFLQVLENDASGTYAGQVNNFSLMDYTSGALIETPCAQTNVDITNNNTTTVTVTAAVNHQKPVVSNLTLPVAEAFEPYQEQLNATGGTAPYHWRFKMGYDVTEQAQSFPTVTQQQLTMSATSDGYTTKTLPFDFPFYGKKYNQIVIYTGGYIEFRNNLYTWPFLVSDDLLFRSHELIAPFKANLVMNAGDGIWLESMPNCVTVRWKMTVSGQASSQVNVAARLYPNGDIEFCYGNINVSSAGTWRAGVSRGNAKEYCIPPISGTFATNTVDKKVLFDHYYAPTMLSLSDDGLLTGTPTEYYNNTPIHIQVIDNNDLINEKSLPFSTSFNNRIVVLSHTEHGGGDNIVNNGELVNVDIAIKNIDTVAVSNAQLVASSTDPYITFTDNTEYFGYIGAGNTYTLANAFKFQVSSDVPNEHPIHIRIDTQCDGLPSTTNIVIVAYASDATLGVVQVFDGNDNTLNHDENDTIAVTITNPGGSAIAHLHGMLNTFEPNIAFINNIDTASSLAPFSSVTLRYVVSLNSSFVDGRMNDFQLMLNGENFSKTLSFSLCSGGNIEDFESGTFTQYPWELSDTAWTIRTDSVFEGTNVARSGMITHNQTSTMSLTEDILVNGFVSFYKKVSCEDGSSNNWDYLAFFIDGQEKERWDGEVDWSQNSYPVTAGNHTFKWLYNKDVSVNTGFDAAWVDYIRFPMFGSSNPMCSVAPDSIHLYLYPTETSQFEVHLMNSAAGIATYQLQIHDVEGYNVPWIQAEYLNGSLNGSESDSITMVVNPHNMAYGDYEATLNATFSNATQYNIPIKLTVLFNDGVSEVQNKEAVKVYPNPAKDRVVFQVPSNSGEKMSISIYTFTGKLIEKLNNPIYSDNNQEFTWSPAGLSAGVYFYQVTAGNYTHRGKIILMP